MKTENNTRMAVEKYRKEFRIMEMAGTGVILTRAREPFRAIDALKEEAEYLHPKRENGMAFKYWNIRDGWCEPSVLAKLGFKGDGNVHPYPALRAVMDLDGNGETPFADGIYVMSNFEQMIEKDFVPIMECLRHYAKDLPRRGIRLVLVVNEGFTLPATLQHDIPIVDFDLPDRGEIGAILHNCLKSALDLDDEEQEDAIAGGVFTDHEKEMLIASASGMTFMECELAFSKAIVKNYKDFPEKVEFREFNDEVLRSKTDVVKRSECLEFMEAGSPNDIGGLENLKDWISYRTKCFSKEAEEFGVAKPKGIALIGSSGCGKSVSAKAISSTLGQPLIRFDISKVFGSLVGQTEGRVRAALKQLEAMAPCIAFLDEIDKAGLGSGGSHDSGTSTRVLGSILTFMQESSAPIFWIFTANRVGNLPPELLRKGRLDEVFSVLPPNRTERKEILKIHLRKSKQDWQGIDLDPVVESSEDYVSAELEAAVKEAVVVSYVTGKPITSDSLIKQIEVIKPMSEAFAEDFDAIRTWAANNARPSSLSDDGDKTGNVVEDARKTVRRIRVGK